MKKNPLWKQPTPFDQLTALIGAIAGDIDNLGEFTTIENVKERGRIITTQMLDLRYFLENPEKWVEGS